MWVITIFVGVTCSGDYVTQLSLSSLGLFGSIPADIGLLSTIQQIDFSYNSLYGSIPVAIGDLVGLQSVDLSNNNLNGTLPSSIVDWVNIRDMVLFSNSLSGTLPDSLGSLATLNTLFLQANLFQGRVPFDICELSNVSIRIDGNSFDCYEDCGSDNNTNIQYGSTELCSPTAAPTQPPAKGLSATVIAIIVVAVVVFFSICTWLIWIWILRLAKHRLYEGYPVHKKVLDGALVTPEFVQAHLDSAVCLFQGKTALMLILDKLSSSCNYSVSEDVLFMLVKNALHFDPLTGDLLSDECRHNYSWCLLVQSDSAVAVSAVQSILQELDMHAELLAHTVDRLSRRCIDIASPNCREVIAESLRLHKKFELKPGPPEHKSATSIVRFAIMHGKDEEGNSIQRPAALKFMKYREQFVTEIGARQAGGFSSEFVINVIESYDGGALDDNNKSFRKSARKKGYGDYPFCVVMEVADSNLQRVIFEQHIAGHDWDMIRWITKSLCGCLAHLHLKGIVHGDLKPLNIVTVNNSVKLIDFDASSSFGNDNANVEFAGAKFSSAYVPPELFHELSNGSIVVRTFTKNVYTGEATGVTKILMSDGTVRYLHHTGYSLVLADPAQDMWACGCILYLLCTGKTLFQASVEDNVSGPEIAEACHWPDSLKVQKLSVVEDKYARNLLSLLLSADPAKRPGADRVVSHPFISGRLPQRLVGDEADYDVFLSYRVDSDFKHVQMLYQALQNLELKVWLDRTCLLPGQPWEEGFCDGLVNSSCFVCLLSRNAVNHPDRPWQNFTKLEECSRCDNVLLEWRLALELRERGLIEGIFPIFIGDCVEIRPGELEYSHYTSSHCGPAPADLPDVSVTSLEHKLRDHLERLGLGTPLETSKSVREIVCAVTGNQGGNFRGNPDNALKSICASIIKMRKAVEDAKTRTYLRAKSVDSSADTVIGVDYIMEQNRKLLQENEILRVSLSRFCDPPNNAVLGEIKEN
jgi:serine/threonine protein kinase